MFDRYILASNFNRIATRFSMAKLPELVDYKPSYNISKGDKCFIINNNQTKEIQLFEFGLNVKDDVMPFVRAEGDRNIYDDPHYYGSKAIFLKPEFKNIIRQQRCLVLADAFVVGVKEMNPYLVYLRNKQRPFSFAGIWNTHIDEESNKEVHSFAIITVTSNRLMHQLGYKRMPVILFPEYESRWVRGSTQLSEVLDMLNPFPYNLMNAYPISTKIADKTLNNISLVQPMGETVYNENITYTRMSRLGKKESNESKVNLSLEERMMKPGK